MRPPVAGPPTLGGQAGGPSTPAGSPTPPLPVDPTPGPGYTGCLPRFLSRSSDLFVCPCPALPSSKLETSRRRVACPHAADGYARPDRRVREAAWRWRDTAR
jgi:hypothetical protein